jgi:16S rRNA (uracil1498-N3)-methyltransferase
MPERHLRRFFTGTPISQTGSKVSLPPSETQHLKKTLRLKVGDACLVTDGTGQEAEAVVTSFTAQGETELRIENVRRPAAAETPSLRLTLYPAFLQKGKMDDLVRQMQELGAEGFFPVETERTIVKMEAQAKARMTERWEKIVREAAKQSGSLKVMKIGGPYTLKEAVAAVPAGEVAAVFHPSADAMPFREWINSFCHPEEGRSPDEGSRSFAAPTVRHRSTKRPTAAWPTGASLRMTQKACHLFFGPEGGFTAAEISRFPASKVVKVGLGPTILKADTAVLGVASALKFLFA